MPSPLEGARVRRVMGARALARTGRRWGERAQMMALGGGALAGFVGIMLSGRTGSVGTGAGVLLLVGMMLGARWRCRDHFRAEAAWRMLPPVRGTSAPRPTPSVREVLQTSRVVTAWRVLLAITAAALLGLLLGSPMLALAERVPVAAVAVLAVGTGTLLLLALRAAIGCRWAVATLDAMLPAADHPYLVARHATVLIRQGHDFAVAWRRVAEAKPELADALLALSDHPQRRGLRGDDLLPFLCHPSADVRERAAGYLADVSPRNGAE